MLRNCPLFAIACLIVSTSCLADQHLVELLNKMGDTVTLINKGKPGEHRYAFSHDADFPCSVSLKEYSTFEGTRWVRQYRFELSDMQTGQLLMAKDRRRAISYYGEKTSQGAVKKFPPKKISSIQLRVPADNSLQTSFNEAILLCEERNTF